MEATARPERIRVLRVIARMNVGGPAAQVAELAHGLDPQRFATRLLTGSVESDEAEYIGFRGHAIERVVVPGLGRSPRAGGDMRALAAIRREIACFRPDIVHTHTAKAGTIGRIAAFLERVPVTVHTFHGHLLRGYFGPAGTAAVRQVERRLARRTTGLVAVGARVRDELLAAGIGRREQYAVVPPGVAVRHAPDANAARAMLGIDGDARVVAFSGRLAPVKRPDRFVEMAHLLAATRDDVVFLVAGSGELLHEVRQAVAPLGHRVRLLGWRSDVEVVYAAADVIALTSDNEGMPVSLIEAALLGRPAVAVEVGSVSEVIEDGVTGLVVPPSTAALAAAVVRLLDDHHLRTAMGRAAQERAEERFGPQRLVDDTERLYLRLCTERGRGPR